MAEQLETVEEVAALINAGSATAALSDLTGETLEFTSLKHKKMLEDSKKLLKY